MVLKKTEQKFVDDIEKRVKQTIEKYKLFNKKDKILVAASGGKDSTVMLYLLQKLGYKIEAITINALIGNYSKISLENLVKFCNEQDIKLHDISLRKEFGYSLCYIKSILNSKGVNIKSCTICGVLRRYLLNKYARKLKATKLVLGHNLDDEAQVILMNIIRGDIAVSARLGPMTGIIKNKKFVPRIKPLYLIREHEIETFSKIMNFPVKYGECPCSTDSLRRNIKSILLDLEKDDPKIREKIINSFLKMLPNLKKIYKSVKDIEYCKKCGEPTSQKYKSSDDHQKSKKLLRQKGLCKTCQILVHLND